MELMNHSNSAHIHNHEVPEPMVASKWQGTDADRHEMAQLGKVQELRRNFTFVGLLGFCCCLVATWEILLTTFAQSLTNGGTAGFLWAYIIVIIGFTFVYLTTAELASMSPTSGGQYHWVSEFAPPSSQKFLSYIVGWLCFTGWQGALCALSFIVGTLIQGLIILNNPNYVYAAWHGTLLAIAVASFAIIFNTLLAKKLPLVQALLLVLHVAGILAIIPVLWAMAPIARARDVLFTFTDAGGWGSSGAATMVGVLSPIVSVGGLDCSVHMSEEVKDASATIPKAMLMAYAFNAVLGFAMAVTIVFTLGDVEEVLASETGYPFMQLFLNTTNSLTAANIMTAIVILALTASAIAEVATASRQIWSFARDRGIPGHRWVARVSPTRNIPLNAVMLSLLVTSLLSLINIGSTVTLLAIFSLVSVSILTSYFIVTAVLVLRRLRGPSLPTRRFNLGKAGLPINIIALCFLGPFIVLSFFPVTKEVELSTMNWSIVMSSGILTIAVVFYFFGGGRQTYVPPVALVHRQDDDKWLGPDGKAHERD